MASSWGNSWGLSWLNSWGAGTPVVPVVPVGRVEVFWPNTHLGRRKHTDYGFIEDIVRQRDEALAEHRKTHAATPVVTVHIPDEMSEEAQLAIRELLAPHRIIAANDDAALKRAFAEMRRAEAYRIQLELQRIEEEEIVMVLALSV